MTTKIQHRAVDQPLSSLKLHIVTPTLTSSFPYRVVQNYHTREKENPQDKEKTNKAKTNKDKTNKQRQTNS